MSKVNFIDFIDNSCNYFITQNFTTLSFDYYGKLGFTISRYKDKNLVFNFTLNFSTIRLIRFTGCFGEFKDFVSKLYIQGYFDFV